MENVSLESLELERKSIKKKSLISILIGVAVLIVSIVVAVMTELIELIIIGILVMVVVAIINAVSTKKYSNKFKDLIVTKLIKDELGVDAVYDPNGGINLGELNSLRFASAPDRYHLSDYISCSYNGVPYEICDCHFEERRVTRDSKGNRQVTYVTYFRGRAIKIDFKRDLNIKMKLVNDGPMGFSAEGLNKFETEVIDFNKRFKCYVDNSENGFYILTPVFIQKLMELERMFKGGLVVIFKHNNLYVLINDGRDSLEVSINKPVNGEQIERIKGEILLPASIINEFRIDDDKYNVNF